MEFSFGKSKRQSISLHSIRKILWCTSFKNHFYVNIKILWPSIVIDFFSIYIFFHIYFVFWYTLMKKDGRKPYMIAMRQDRNRSKRLKQYCFKLFWRQIIGDCSSFSYTEKQSYTKYYEFLIINLSCGIKNKSPATIILLVL